MSEIKRLKVFFIDKDTMMVVNKPSHVVVHLDLRTNELVAQSFDVEFNGEPKEVEIRIND